jgi:uncharacterized protein (TIGR00369 family)
MSGKITRLAPNPENRCFGCGGANEQGMRLEFEADEERQRIVGRFELGAEYQGGAGFLHGGVIALLMDEAMGKQCRFRGVRAVTAELNVEFRRPIGVGEKIEIEAWEERKEGRSLFHAAEIRNAAGEVKARGTGRFVEVDPERYGKVLAAAGAK